ncbi:tungsten formylmethanofuran dehydrogenase [Chryseobacterium piperi]|uniref:Propionate 3-nitronate monooxygenase n=1 Tax=Chryseobacterium piperi TaxID=558152 RepID=A0A085ZZR8_9FLAO|nr:nitronate monooxygenase [Chryseobacterium piperi]ASW74501.1 nitronate monooxygenase [Chryseobacterium piperi]ASW74879.1 nitronate monooxygenase [Chryseobacterium piperi]KFF09932.1 tungsten formylmethanofuran dehydrogenase [Chryseobacterium piperi]
MFWANAISERLCIEYPIIQAPMFGISTPAMTSAASNRGCLGSLALADLSPDQSAQLIRNTKQLTDRPFAVNIFVHQIPEVTDSLKEKFIEVKEFIEELAKENSLEVHLPNFEDLKINTYHEQIDIIIEEGCKILSFTFGNLDGQSIQKLKENGVVLIGTCTSVKEALLLEKSGIDMICVQGIEAGGHRGTFDTESIPQIGGLSLLSQVYDAVSVPLMYAGGLYNAKTLLASKKLGAQGFQVGSVLLASQESAMKPFEKGRLERVQEEDILLTKSFSGRYARGIKNRFIEAIEDSDYILPYPYHNKLTGELRKAAKVNENDDFVNIWVGQSIHHYSEDSTSDILKSLILDVEKD